MPLLARCKRLFTKPHLRLIALIGLAVPRRLRADWRQEWEAELRHREELLAEWDKLDWRHRLDLLRRSTSAFWDALWLQQLRNSDGRTRCGKIYVMACACYGSNPASL